MKLFLNILLLCAFINLSFAQKNDAVFDKEQIVKTPLEYPPDSNKNSNILLVEVVENKDYNQRSLCDASALPLRIVFSNYTINESGIIQNDGGWTQGERDAYLGFICKMMPILVELYGEPYEVYDLNIIKDLRFITSAMFLPTDRSIRTGGRYWSPQLITHELLHAFRGRWHITTANNSSQYDPKLSGFEEGFAQAVSYEAMNKYIDTYGFDQYVNRNILYTPDTFWDYDYKNDASMITEDFWSDEGGTRKYFERYEQSAAAIQQLNVRIPNFYANFNSVYYTAIRYNPQFSISRETILQLIDSLTDDKNIVSWLNQQNILQCRTIYGKKIYTTTQKSGYHFAYHRIHFIETFPNKNEWYYYIQNDGYLYHRLNYTIGYMNIMRSWNNSTYRRNEILNMKDLPGWTDYQACGINCSKGFAADDLLFYFGTVPPTTGFNNPLLIPHPTQTGLYILSMRYNNPHVSILPDYNIYYDRTQFSVNETKYELLGISMENWNNNKIFGGVANLSTGSGFVQITHSLYPNEILNVNIINGLFMTNGLNNWYQNYRGFISSKSGVLTFKFYDSTGKFLFTDKRFITFGDSSGRHKFLFHAPLQPMKIKAVGPN